MVVVVYAGVLPAALVSVNSQRYLWGLEALTFPPLHCNDGGMDAIEKKVTRAEGK